MTHELIDGVLYRINTNPWRRAHANFGKRKRRNRSMLRQEHNGLTALAHLASVWSVADRTSVSAELLVSALVEVEQRLVDLAASIRTTPGAVSGRSGSVVGHSASTQRLQETSS